MSFPFNKIRVIVRNLGRMSFRKALTVQEETSRTILNALKDKNNNYRNTLILVEHDPVYTIGIRRELYDKEDEKELRSLGADFIRTNRGGLITFHGPGQLVAYPILYLGDFSAKKSMKWYICKLEKTVIEMCSYYGIKAGTSPHTGVWVGDNKIAAIGVHGSRYVTTHGVAINCNIDLSWFDHIVPCGIENKGVTSLSKELGQETSVSQVTPVFLTAFEKEFGCTVYLET